MLDIPSLPCSEHCHNQVEPDSNLSQMLHVTLLFFLDFSATGDVDMLRKFSRSGHAEEVGTPGNSPPTSDLLGTCE